MPRERVVARAGYPEAPPRPLHSSRTIASRFHAHACGPAGHGGGGTSVAAARGGDDESAACAAAALSPRGATTGDDAGDESAGEAAGCESAGERDGGGECGGECGGGAARFVDPYARLLRATGHDEMFQP